MQPTKLDSSSASVRARLDHPVIDADGHYIEIPYLYEDYVVQVGGSTALEEYRRSYLEGVHRMAVDPAEYMSRGAARREEAYSRAERERWRFPRGNWWAAASDTRTRATCQLPRLLRERLDELGIDFMLIYPTTGLFQLQFRSDELREIVCRATNMMAFDMFEEHADRIAAVAVIPMHTPAAAIAELEFCTGELGMKAAVIQGHVRRPVPGVAETAPAAAAYARYIDVYGIDSAYDYDPFWRKCVELKVPLSSHESGIGLGERQSVTNFVYNHVGHFASAQHALCKSLLLGGVFQRFKELRFAFLEGGAGWAATLYADLVERWETRGPTGILRVNPANLDVGEYMSLARRYGGKLLAGKLDGLALDMAAYAASGAQPTEIIEGRAPAARDDFAQSGFLRPEDIADAFSRLYFGCESEDRSVAWASNTRAHPFGARINAIFSSDIGHFDVSDITATVAEAYELVEHELISRADFERFAFGNAVDFLAGANPDFFRGTSVEQPVRAHRRSGERA